MTSLKAVDLSRCSKVTDAGIKHLLSIQTLKKLCISETGVTANGVTLLSSLTNLSMLDLGGLCINDQALCSLQVYYIYILLYIFSVACFIWVFTSLSTFWSLKYDIKLRLELGISIFILNVYRHYMFIYVCILLICRLE